MLQSISWGHASGLLCLHTACRKYSKSSKANVINQGRFTQTGSSGLERLSWETVAETACGSQRTEGKEIREVAVLHMADAWNIMFNLLSVVKLGIDKSRDGAEKCQKC